MTFWLYRSLALLCRILPPGLRYRLAHLLAWLYWLCGGRARRSLHGNLQVVLGASASPKEIGRQARLAFRSFGSYLSEFFGFRNYTPAFWERNVSYVGLEHLQRALAGGRGCLLVSGHYSNWELGAVAVAHRGHPIVAITQEHADPRVNALFVEQRAALGVTVRHSRQGALAALRALKENRPVAILGDRSTGGPTVQTELFGRQTALPQGPWRLAVDTGAPLLPTYVSRRAEGRYSLTFEAPLQIPPCGSRSERVASAASQFAARLEAWIRADPSQWAVFHQVWPPTDASALAEGTTPGAPRRTPLHWAQCPPAKGGLSLQEERCG